MSIDIKPDIEVAKTRESVYPMTFNIRATSKIRLEITVTSAISMPFKAYGRMSRENRCHVFVSY